MVSQNENLGSAVLELSTDNAKLGKGLKSGERQTKTAMGNMAATVARNRRAIGVGMTAIGAVIAGFAVATIKAAATFDAQMREVNSLLGLTSVEFDKLKNDTLAMSAALGVDAVESASALYQAISAGVPRDNVFEFMEVATKAAIAGVTDTETSVDGLTTVINAFGLDIGEAQRVADVMFTAVKGGKTTFDELSASMFQAAPLAAVMGISFEEVAAATATLTKQGTPTKVAMTQLRQVMISLQKPTEGMKDLINELGFASGGALLEAEGLQGALQLLATESGASEEELAKAFGAVEALGAVFGLTGDKATEAAADLEASFNAAGAATEAFNIVNASSSRQMEIMFSRLKVLAIQIGTVLLPIVVAITQKVSNFVRMISDWASEHQTLTKVITIAVIGIGALLLVLGPLVIMLPAIAAGLALMAGASGIGLVILAITALTTVAIILFRNWRTIWTKIKELTNTVGNFLIDTFNKLTFVQRQYIVKMLETVQAVANLASKLPGLGGKFKGVADSIQVAIDKVKTGIPSFELATQAVDGFSSTMSEASEEMDGFGTTVVDTMTEAGAAMGTFADETGLHLRKATEDIEGYAAAVKLARDQQVEGLRDQIVERLKWAEDEKLALQSVAQEAEVQAQREITARSRVAATWDTFVQNLNPVIARLKDMNLDFGQTVALLAEKFGVNTQQMADHLAGMGISFGDTFALITKFGEDWMNSFLNTLGSVRQAATGGGGGGRRQLDQNEISNLVHNFNVLTGRFTPGGESRIPGRTLDEIANDRAQLKAVVTRLKELRIPGFRVGGIAETEMLATVGEVPEAIIPLSRLDALAGGGGITFNGPVYGLPDFERTVAAILVRQRRRGGGE